MEIQLTPWRHLPGWVEHREHWFVLTDPHGRFEPFRLLLASVPDGATVIHLGDIGDRGDDSIACYELLASMPDIMLIRGNHDMMLQQAMFLSTNYRDIGRWLKLWKMNGGREFHASLAKDKNAQTMVKSVLSRQKLYHFDGNLFFVHAGLTPQDDFRLLARKQFLSGMDLHFNPPDHLAWAGDGYDFWEATDQTEWKGFDVKPFFVHGHRACQRISATECDPGYKVNVWPREDSWRIGVDDRDGMTAVEILGGQYRFYTIDGCGLIDE